MSSIPVSAPRNLFYDGENVDDIALTLEQNYNNQIQNSIKDGHLGSGVIPSSLTANVLFDSSVLNTLVDGVVLTPQAQPSDTSNGNQLSIQLSGSNAAGNKTVKVLILGLDFENNLQYDALIFHTNETQLTSKHYTYIVAILFNDLIGAPTQSLNLGGRVVVQETSPITLSRDVLMIAQNVQPNLFFRDFFTASGITVSGLLTSALPNYNINNLNIQIGYSQLRAIVENDVSSQIGQKFIATGTNIQKATLLLSVYDDITPANTVWSGEILISIYALQSSVSCPTNIIPQLAIDFDPSNTPIAQLSFSYGTLQNAGIVLNNTPQPVDFVFSNTAAGSGASITPGNYYAITIKRAGSAGTAQIQVAVGTNSATNTRETLFNGSTWTDVPNEAIWFEIWTDAAKVSDGQAYDVGEGIVIPKNQIDPTTGLTQDYVLNQLPFSRNDIFYARLQATNNEFEPVQDPRTGNNVFSEQQSIPSVSLMNATALAAIPVSAEPLIIGTITDQNVKTYVAGTTLLSNFHEYGFVHNQIVAKIITDQTDGYRYDTSLINLVQSITNGALNGALITPDVANPSKFYRIVKAEYLTMIYGDVNGDGIITNDDLLAAQNLIGYNLNIAPTYNQYVSLTTYFVNDINVSWQIINSNNTIIASGTDGVLTVLPANPTQVNLHSGSANFSSIQNLSSYSIIFSNSSKSAGNNGTFQIQNLVDTNDIVVQKQYYTSDVLLQVMRANVSNSMTVSSTDTNAITNYIELTPPFPAISAPGNRIGTTFNAIRFTVEPFVDRADDYPSNISNRSSSIHSTPDIYLDGYTYFGGLNFETSPVQFSVVPQLVWYETSVVSTSTPRLVEASFNYQSDGYQLNSCSITGIISQTFPQPPAFSPGHNDIFIPDNLIINYGGQLVQPDGYFYKIDFEMATVLIEIPAVNFNGEQTVNVFNDVVANYSSTGYTRLGYEAMRFADCSFVGMDALSKNQIRFGVAVQSLSPQLNGVDGSGNMGIIVDDRAGISMDYTTGILTLQFNNLYQDPVQQTLNTKVQITVYLKKGGWNNNTLFIPSTTSVNWLNV